MCTPQLSNGQPRNGPGRLASQAAVEGNGAASVVVAEEEECEGEAEDGYCSAQEFSSEVKEPAVDDLRDSRAEEPRKEQQVASPVITWQLVVGLVLRHKLRLVGLAVGLIAGTTCNVVLPRINGNFVQALVAPVPVPLAQLLLPIAAIYVLEPAATLLFVSSLSAVWEAVMAAVRVRIQGLVNTMVDVQNALSAICLRAFPPLMPKPTLLHSSRVTRLFPPPPPLQIQGLVNTMADVQNALSAVARINALLSASPPEPNLSIPEPLPDLSVPLPASTPCPEPAAVGVVGEAEEKEGLMAVQRGNGTVVGGGRGLSACELAWTGDIEFRDVCFAYPQRAAVEVIKGINLVLPRGSVTALVGGSGAGKSTVVQLLSQFYEVRCGVMRCGAMGHGPSLHRWFTEGALVRVAVPLIVAEDVGVRTVYVYVRPVLYPSSSTLSTLRLPPVPPSPAHLLSGVYVHVPCVWLQEPVLFAMSVRDNIAYGLPDADVSEADVIRAAKAANAHEFIVKLPQGYDTMVGERGGLLSGGQRQRLAIARAILKDAPILILDEATSALDSVSERLVQQALEGLMQGRTTLVIAHRLSTVQAADQIVVMAAGRLVERGTHAQLVALGGAYATLVNAQHLTFE
ncbi:unnamed protein product [Closterium sp. NIES-53]